MKKLNIFLTQLDDGIGYDITIRDKNATISDYIKELDDFLEEKIAPCIGCDSCCHERIPVTLPDITNYVNDKDNIPAILETIEKYFDIIVLDPAIDIKIKQKPNGSCIFLNEEESKCNAYYKRSLVCHSHICIPKEENAEDLRSQLVNIGEDALIGYLINITNGNPKYSYLQRHSEDYPVLEYWNNKTYDNIYIIDIITEELWNNIYKP